MKTITDHIQESLLNESSKTYEIYHPTYTSAVQEIRNYISKQSMMVDEDEFSRVFGFDNSRPADGQTVKGSVKAIKNGKEQRKMFHAQITGLSKSFELNIYYN